MIMVMMMMVEGRGLRLLGAEEGLGLRLQLLDENVQRFRDGPVFKAQRRLHHSTLGSSV